MSNTRRGKTRLFVSRTPHAVDLFHYYAQLGYNHKQHTSRSLQELINGLHMTIKIFQDILVLNFRQHYKLRSIKP